MEWSCSSKDESGLHPEAGSEFWPTSHIKAGKGEKERDAVGINNQEGSGSLQVSDLTSHPKAGCFNFSTRCEPLCNQRIIDR